MKKIILATLIIGFAFNSSAQQYRYKLADAVISSITVKEGKNTLLTKHGKGTLEFNKTGENFSNIRFLDSLGKPHVLTALPANTTGVPKPDCSGSQTGFISKNKDIAMFICKEQSAAGKVTNLTVTFSTATGADRYSLKNFKMGQYK